MGSRLLDALVIGAGVSGLTTAVCLAEAGLRVAIVAAEPPQHTTSSAAGAIWGPHLVGRDARVAGWAAVTLDRLRQMAADPATGIREIGGITSSRTVQEGSAARRDGAARQDPAAHQDPADAARPPKWTDGVGERVRCEDSELPGGFTSGWRFSAPVISMRTYLDYLLDRFAGAGGSVQYGRTFASLAAVAAEVSADVIVNCSGIGASGLVPDPEMVPVRGQAVVVANPGIGEFFIGIGEEPGDLTYLFPHQGHVVLGGTEQPGSWDRRPDPATAARILRLCAAIEPALAQSAVLAHKVGLRPMRPTVRLEAESTADGRLLLHNYGHGGAGVTLSWGCALEITRAVLERSR